MILYDLADKLNSHDVFVEAIRRVGEPAGKRGDSPRVAVEDVKDRLAVRSCHSPHPAIRLHCMTRSGVSVIEQRLTFTRWAQLHFRWEGSRPGAGRAASVARARRTDRVT